MIVRPHKTGKRWDKVIARPSQLQNDLNIKTSSFYGEVDLGDGTSLKIGMFWVNDTRLFVGIEGYGAYTFGTYVDPSYAYEKLIHNKIDAGNLSDFINTQLDENYYEAGRYDSQYIQE
jgi:hypothetical protein